jgi:DNA polymerase III delta subunit
VPASLSFEGFQESLKQGKVSPAYLFEGAEAHFHDEGIRLLESACVPGEALSIDRESLRGSEISLAAILDLASTYPMGGGLRLVIVRQAGEVRCDDAAPIKAYLKAPNPKACLVFSDPGFDRRRTLYRTLLDLAVRVDCSPLDETRTATWVRERLRGRGFGLSPDLAAAVAAGLAGAGLARVSSEMDRLMNAIGSPRPVEASDLVLVADVPRVEDAFRLAAHLVRGERGEAIGIARALLRSGEEPVKLLGGISWYVRNALRARAAETRRLPPHESTRLYGIDRGRIERFSREMGRASVDDLRDALALCLRTDRELKGRGARDPLHALERLVHHAGRRPRRSA